MSGAKALPAVLTLEEASAFLRLSRKTVVKLASAGDIPHRKVGPQWRFLLSALEEYLHGSSAAKTG